MTNISLNFEFLGFILLENDKKCVFCVICRSLAWFGVSRSVQIWKFRPYYGCWTSTDSVRYVFDRNICLNFAFLCAFFVFKQQKMRILRDCTVIWTGVELPVRVQIWVFRSYFGSSTSIFSSEYAYATHMCLNFAFLVFILHASCHKCTFFTTFYE